MPHDFPQALRERVAAGSLTLTELVRIEPPYGAALSLTRFPVDLTVGSVTYKAAPGMTLTKTQSSIELSVDNAECTTLWEEGLPGTVLIGIGDLLGGRFEKARWWRGVLDYEDIPAGIGVTGRGRVGIIKVTDHQVMFELLSLSQIVQQQTGEVLSPGCRIVRLGDAWCRANLAGVGPKSQPYRISGVTVDELAGEMSFYHNGHPEIVDTGWFRAGYAIFQGGPNAGMEVEIADHVVAAAGRHFFQMLYPPGWGLAVGRDSFLAEAGCDRTFDSCDGKFSNKYNYRGEPFATGDTDLSVGAEIKKNT